MVDVGGKVCGLDPNGPHRSVALSRRILIMDDVGDGDSNDRIRICCQMLVESHVDVVIISNLEHSSRATVVGYLEKKVFGRKILIICE